MAYQIPLSAVSSVSTPSAAATPSTPPVQAAIMEPVSGFLNGWAPTSRASLAEKVLLQSPVGNSVVPALSLPGVHVTNGYGSYSSPEQKTVIVRRAATPTRTTPRALSPTNRQGSPARSHVTSASSLSTPVGTHQAAARSRGPIVRALTPSQVRVVSSSKATSSRATERSSSSTAKNDLCNLCAGSQTKAFSPGNDAVVTNVIKSPSVEQLFSIQAPQQSLFVQGVMSRPIAPAEVGPRLQKVEMEMAESANKREELARTVVQHSRKLADIVAEACKDIVDTRGAVDSLAARLNALENGGAGCAGSSIEARVRSLEERCAAALRVGTCSTPSAPFSADTPLTDVTSTPRALSQLEQQCVEELPSLVEQCAIARAVAENTRTRLAVLEASNSAEDVCQVTQDCADMRGVVDHNNERLVQLEQFRQELASGVSRELDGALEARVRIIAEEVTTASERAMAMYVDSVRTELSSRVEQVTQNCSEGFRSLGLSTSMPASSAPEVFTTPETNGVSCAQAATAASCASSNGVASALSVSGGVSGEQCRPSHSHTSSRAQGWGDALDASGVGDAGFSSADSPGNDRIASPFPPRR